MQVKKHVLAILTLAFVLFQASCWAQEIVQVDDILARRIAGVEDATREHGEGSAEHMFALAQLLFFMDMSGTIRESIKYAKESVRLMAGAKGENDKEVKKFTKDLIRRYCKVGDYSGAAVTLDKHRQKLEALLGPNSIDVLGAMHDVALLYGMAQDLDGANRIFEVLIPRLEANIDLNHRDLIIALQEWAELYARAGQKSKADSLRHRSLVLVRQFRRTNGIENLGLSTSEEESLYSEVSDTVVMHGHISAEYFLALGRLGDTYEKKHLLADAVRVARQAINIAELMCGVMNRAPMVDVLTDIAWKHTELEEYDVAILQYEKALDVLHLVDGGNDKKIAQIEHNIAVLLVQSGRFSEAMPKFEECLPHIQDAFGSDSELEANLLAFWAIAEMQTGQVDSSLRVADRALYLISQIEKPDPEIYLRVQSKFVDLNFQAGRYEEVLPVEENILKYAIELYGEDDPRIPGVYNDMALYYIIAGHLLEARLAGDKALTLGLRAYDENNLELATIFNTVGEIYARVGDIETAKDYLQHSLSIRTRVLGTANPKVVEVLSNLASLRSDSNKASTILALENGISLIEKQPNVDKLRLAIFYHNLATLLVSDISILEASEPAKKALNIRESLLPDNHPDLFASRALYGAIRVLKGEARDAVEDLKNAIIKSGSGNSSKRTDSFAKLFMTIGYAYLKQDELSIVWGKEVLNSLQSVRRQNETWYGGQPLPLSSFERLTFEVVGALLIKKGRIAEAQRILQMLKEHEFQQDMRGMKDNQRHSLIDLTGLERSKFSEYYRLRDQQSELAMEKLALERKARISRLSDFEQARLYKVSDSLMPQVVKAMRVFMKRLETDMASSAKMVGQNSDSLVQEASYLRKAVDGLAVSEPNASAVGIQYLVGEETLSIILTVPGAPPIAYQQAIDRTHFYQNLRAVLTQLQSSHSDQKFLTKPLQELHATLIGPILSDLKRVGARTLMLSLDDKLRMLPFAALLGSDGRYLVQDYTIAIFNEAAGRDLEEAGARNWTVAAMGLSEPVDDLPKLPFVPSELKNVVTAPGVKGDIYLNNRFSRQRLDAVLTHKSGPYNVLHVASHFRFQPGDPDASYLYLGDKSHLSLSDMSRMSVDLDSFDLVTYSACETGKSGGKDATGRELESLGTLTQRLGAQAIVVTLWKVSDQSTSAFMNHFYTQRTKSLNKAEAIRATQIAMIQKQLVGKSNEDWSSPFHWAAFTVMGNWR